MDLLPLITSAAKIGITTLTFKNDCHRKWPVFFIDAAQKSPVYWSIHNGRIKFARKLGEVREKFVHQLSAKEMVELQRVVYFILLNVNDDIVCVQLLELAKDKFSYTINVDIRWRNVTALHFAMEIGRSDNLCSALVTLGFDQTHSVPLLLDGNNNDSGDDDDISDEEDDEDSGDVVMIRMHDMVRGDRRLPFRRGASIIELAIECGHVQLLSKLSSAEKTRHLFELSSVNSESRFRSVRLLLEAKACPNAKYGEEPEPMLVHFARNSQVDDGCLALLKEFGADVSVLDRRPIPMLYELVNDLADEALCLAVVDIGVNVNRSVFLSGKNALTDAIIRQYSVEFIGYLLSRGAKPDKVVLDGPHHVAPLHLAQERENDEAVAITAMLLSFGADANITTDSDATPLHTAISAATVSVAVGEKLIDAGAEVNAKMSGGLTPLHLAVELQPTAVDWIELLLEKGALVTSRSSEGLSPLHSVFAETWLDENVELDYEARVSMCADFVKLLLSKKESLINAKTHDDMSPLMLALINGYPDSICHLLLTKGSEMLEPCRFGVSALTIAATASHPVPITLTAMMCAYSPERIESTLSSEFGYLFFFVPSLGEFGSLDALGENLTRALRFVVHPGRLLRQLEAELFGYALEASNAAVPVEWLVDLHQQCDSVRTLFELSQLSIRGSVSEDTEHSLKPNLCRLPLPSVLRNFLALGVLIDEEPNGENGESSDE